MLNFRPPKCGARRSRSHRNQLRIERLENRIVFSTASISGASIVYNAATGEANDLEISESAGIISLKDAGGTISPSPEYTVISANEVTIPVGSFTQILVNLGDLNDSVDASLVAASSGLVRTVIDAGSGTNTVIGSQLGDDLLHSTGSTTYDAGPNPIGRSDRLIVTADANMIFNDGVFQVGAQFNSYQGVEFLSVNGGASGNVIDASGVTALSGILSTAINGHGGDDTLVGSQLKDSFRLSDGNDSYDGQSSPVGQGDEINTNNDADMTLTDGLLIVGPFTNSHTAIENFSLVGGASDNVIDASAVTLVSDIRSITFVGQGGDDTLIGSPLSDQFIEGPGEDSYDGQAAPTGQTDALNLFSTAGDVTVLDDQILVAGEANQITDVERLSLSGDSGDNVFDVSALTTATDVTVASLSGAGGSDVFKAGDQASAQIFVVGNADHDTLDLTSFSSAPNIANLTVGTIDGQQGMVGGLIFFNNINDILLPELNHPPVITSIHVDATFANKGTVNEPVQLTVEFDDPDAMDTHVASIDWGDGSSSLGTISNGMVSASHAYSMGGLFSISVLLTDLEGAQDTAVSQAVVTGAGIVGDTLYIIGTNQDDHVTLNRHHHDRLKVHANFLGTPHVSFANAASINQVIAYLCDGDDRFHAAGNVNQSLIVHGGAGDDRLHAGGGAAVLLGGAGNDRLYAGHSRSILIGGVGRDRLRGGRDEDILIGGSTTIDAHDLALVDLLQVWNGPNDWSDRVNQVDLLMDVITDDEVDRISSIQPHDWVMAGAEDELRRRGRC